MLFAVCLLSALGVAALADPDLLTSLVSIFKDFHGGAYLIGMAAVVALVVSLAKQGWLSTWLASKLPATALPYLAVALAFLGTWGTEVQAGTSWSQALVDAVKIAAMAVFGHQVVVEGMRRGKELVPARCGGGPVPPASSGQPAKPPAPPAPPTSARRRLRWVSPIRLVSATLFAALLLGCLSSAPIVPVTPANQQQVSACQTIATDHNAVVVGDFVLGGATTTLGAVAGMLPADQTNTKSTLAITAAAVGAVGIVGTAIAGMTASDFSNSQCSSVVGALPANARDGGQ